MTLILAAGTGCVLGTAKQQPPNRYYDLGSGPVAAANCSYDINLHVAEAQPHLRGNRMWYRRAVAPFELTSYAISRWVAPPSQMLRQRLRLAFQHDLRRTSRSTPLMSVSLELRLTRMELAITDHDGSEEMSARSVIELSASIMTDGEQSGARLFRLHEPATISPAGNAEAMARAVDKLPTLLCNWLITHERPPSAAAM